MMKKKERCSCSGDPEAAKIEDFEEEKANSEGAGSGVYLTSEELGGSLTYVMREESPRYEYWDGIPEAMAGASVSHGILVGNAYYLLRQGLLGHPGCQAFTGEIRVAIDDSLNFFHPDGFVACGDLEMSELAPQAVTNPVVIIEVLSSTTEGRDRGKKFAEYRRLPTFRDYVLISQDTPCVEVYSRLDDQSWAMRVVHGLEASVHLESIDLVLPMREIYQSIRF